VRKNGKRVWVPSERLPRGHLSRNRDPILRKRYPLYHNPQQHQNEWPHSRDARKGVWKQVPGTGRYRTRNGKRQWVPARRYYRPYTKSPYNGNGSRDLRSPYWNRHHRRQRLKPVMQRLNRGSLPRGFKSRYVPRKRYQKQFHPPFAKGETRPARRDRFRPLSKNPQRFKPRDTRDLSAAKLNGPLTAGAGLGYINGKPPPQAAGPVTGPKTEAEKALLEGIGGKEDPFRSMHQALKDEEEPAESVLQDAKDDQLNRAPGGEPLTDALQNSWDMHNGVADP